VQGGFIVEELGIFRNSEFPRVFYCPETLGGRLGNYLKTELLRPLHQGSDLLLAMPCLIVFHPFVHILLDIAGAPLCENLR
jgi:hypothetical protein